MNNYEMLNAAADYIQENGWCRGELRDGIGRVCAVGSIYAVAYEFDTKLTSGDYYMNSDKAAAREHLAAYLDLVEPEDIDGCYADAIPDWNDTVARSATEVIQALRAAAMTATDAPLAVKEAATA